MASQSLVACVTKLDIVSVTVVAAYSDIEHDSDDPYVSVGDDEMYDTSVEDKSMACAAPGQKSSMYNVVCTWDTDAVKPVPWVAPSDVNSTYMKSPEDRYVVVAGMAPDKRASCVAEAELPSYSVKKSAALCVLKDVSVSDTAVADTNTMPQFMLFGYEPLDAAIVESTVDTYTYAGPGQLFVSRSALGVTVAVKPDATTDASDVNDSSM